MLDALARLAGDGLIERRGERYRTTRRWQAAMARAAFQLAARGEADGDDLRVPIAYALCEVYDSRCSDEELVELCAALLPIEAVELDPTLREA